MWILPCVTFEDSGQFGSLKHQLFNPLRLYYSHCQRCELPTQRGLETKNFEFQRILLLYLCFMRTSYQTTQDTFDLIRTFVCGKLKLLDEHLTYHNLAHTLDVVKQSERIARKEGVTDEHKIFLLKVAALYHDTGFIITYANHETASCEIFLCDAPQFNLSKEEQHFINRLIMATKLPQTPSDIFEQVICDADLDYLGRPDFFRIGDGLRKEFLHFKIVSSNEEWEKLQIRFLTSHHYHTDSCKKSREAKKQYHIAQLR
jgi:predicted metal-dependent HD superfamily phosphohydrolase